MTSPVACSTKWRKGGDKWHSVILRAIAEENDPS
jgi:DMSO/TMAO reductase YedYZ molybdopterin-dependent catalytic subunit